jgi:hypothetical protein
VTPRNRQFTDDAEYGNRRVVSLHQAGGQFHAAGTNRDIADADPVGQAGKGVGRERHVALIAHDEVAEGIFSLHNAVKQSAGLATGNAKDVRGTTLEQKLGKMIAGMHK